MTDEAQRSEPTIVCDGCGKTYLKKVYPSGRIYGEPPERGWILPYKQFGYYGGFDDSGLFDDGEDWWLCHDCVLKFMDTFPLLAEQMVGGLHPNGNEPHDDDEDGTNYPPCCRFAWTFRVSYDENGKKAIETFVATPEGGWEKSPD